MRRRWVYLFDLDQLHPSASVAGCSGMEAALRSSRTRRETRPWSEALEVCPHLWAPRLLTFSFWLQIRVSSSSNLTLSTSCLSLERC